MPPRTDEAKAWYGAVYAAVQQIPYGKITSYAHIAYLLGYPQRPRQVGVCLKHLPSDPGGGDVDGNVAETDGRPPRYHSGNVPWQRVISSKGMISSRGPGSVARHAAAIGAEGVEVVRGSLGEQTIDFARFGWFPSALPGEELSDDDDEEGEGAGEDSGT